MAHFVRLSSRGASPAQSSFVYAGRTPALEGGDMATKYGITDLGTGTVARVAKSDSFSPRSRGYKALIFS